MESSYLVRIFLLLQTFAGARQLQQQECALCPPPIRFDPNVHKPVYKVGALRTPLLLRTLNATFQDYLTATVGQRFDPPIRFEAAIFPDQIAGYDLAEAKDIDFVQSTPGHSSCMEAEYGTRHLLNTIRTSTTGGETVGLSHFAGLVITHVDNTDINTLADLKGKVIATNRPTNLGGAAAQFIEMKKQGMSYLNGPAALAFAPNMGVITKNVFNKKVDAGFIRTRFLEPFARRTPGVNASAIKVVGVKTEEDPSGVPFPLERSTAILPEWQFAAFQHTPVDVATEVQNALLAFETHGKIGLAREACIQANNVTNSTAQCDDLKALDPLSPCDATVESVVAAASVLSANDYNTFRTPLSFNRIRKLLDDFGIIKRDPSLDSWKCYKFTEFYDQISCPDGLFKLARDAFEASCNKTGIVCPDGLNCICKPCFEALPIEVAPAEKYSPGAGCEKMSICGEVAQNEELNFTIVDNQKLETGRQLWARALEDDGDTEIAVVAGPSPHTYSFSLSTSIVGVFILEIFDGERQIEASPLRVRVTYRSCPGDMEASEDGVCECKASSLAIGESCTELWLVVVVALIPLIVIAGILLFFFVRQKEREANSLWIVNPSELRFDEPPTVLGRGSFGFVLQAEYRGSKVAVKRVVPPSNNSRKGSKRSHDTRMFCPSLEQASTESVAVISIDEEAPNASVHSITDSDVETGSEDRSERKQVNFESKARLSVSAREGTRSSLFTGTTSRGKSSMRKMKQVFMEEMRVLSKLRHPNITTVMGAVVASNDPMLIMEYMEHGSLYEVLQNPTIVLEADLVLRVIKDIAHGVRFLHSSNPPVIHGDLKSGNVLIDSTFRAKLADFGMAKRKNNSTATTSTGTPLWMAPELLSNKSPNTPMSDMYSVGVILNEIVSGKEPYHDTRGDLQTILKGVVNPKINRRPEIPSNCPVKVKKLIMFLWHNEPSQRPTANELNNRLEDMSEQVFASCCGAAGSHRSPSVKQPQNSMQDDFLYQAFPRHVADVLRSGDKVVPESHDCVSICFSDIVGFTTIASKLEPLKVSNMLDRLYMKFDEITKKHELFKVETVGDAYMCAANLANDQHGDHAKRIALYARDIRQAASETLIDEDDLAFGYTKIRVGFHSGPVVSNVVGSLNPRYGLFGDTVNIAARMETTSIVGKVHCSEFSAKLLKDQAPEITIKSRGRTEIKGRGKMMTYWVA